MLETVPLNAVDEVFTNWSAKLGDGTLCASVLFFEGPVPSLPELRTHLRDRLPYLPGLTWHSSGRRGEETWQPDPCFRLDDHIAAYEMPHHRLTPDAVAEALRRHPMPADAAPWRLCLVRDPACEYGPFAIGVTMDHRAYDGAWAGLAVSVLLGDKPPDRAVTVDSAVPDRLGFRQTLHDLGAAVRNLAIGARWGAHLNTRSRAVASAEIPLSLLRAVRASSGATINQIHVAAVAGAVRARGTRPPCNGRRPIYAAVPLSTRAHEAGGFTPGNQIAVQRVALPWAEPDPLRRLRLVQKSSNPRDTEAIRQLSRHVTTTAPHWITRAVVRGLTHPWFTPVVVNNVRLEGDHSWDGIRVTTAGFLPPHIPGHVLTALLASYGDRARITFSVAASVPEPQRLPYLWVKEIRALSAATAAADSAPSGVNVVSLPASGRT
ncbi:WS/DGAT domain-containing protein [Streptomyces sp. NPDC057238]|uniref:WS/DGAT domain-containing protein n=1 Tax=Streptomyces sp. NPDC057238 TaxID=3346060 RepID=UPI003642BDF6